MVPAGIDTVNELNTEFSLTFISNLFDHWSGWFIKKNVSNDAEKCTVSMGTG